jgi:hypothetical protein
VAWPRYERGFYKIKSVVKFKYSVERKGSAVHVSNFPESLRSRCLLNPDIPHSTLRSSVVDIAAAEVLTTHCLRQLDNPYHNQFCSISSHRTDLHYLPPSSTYVLIVIPFHCYVIDLPPLHFTRYLQFVIKLPNYRFTDLKEKHNNIVNFYKLYEACT